MACYQGQEWKPHLKALTAWNLEGLDDVINDCAGSCGSESHDRQAGTDFSLQASKCSQLCDREATLALALLQPVLGAVQGTAF